MDIESFEKAKLLNKEKEELLYEIDFFRNSCANVRGILDLKGVSNGSNIPSFLFESFKKNAINCLLVRISEIEKEMSEL